MVAAPVRPRSSNNDWKRAPRNTPQEQKRAVILDAARMEFAACGFGATKLAAVAMRAGLRKPTLFHYVTGKEHLYELAVADALRELANDIELAHDRCPLGADARLAAIVTALHAACARQPVLAPLVRRSLIDAPTASSEAEAALARIVAAFAAPIRDGIDAGRIERCDATRAAASIVLMLCTGDGCLLPPRDDDDGADAAAKSARVVAQVTRLLARA